MVTFLLEKKKQRGIALVIPLLAFLALVLMPAASAYTATLVSPADIKNVHNGDLVSIQVNGLAPNNIFQLNISSNDLNTPGGTFSINNFAMPFGYVNGTASTYLVGDNLNASGLQLVVARADGVTIIQQNQTTSNPYRIYMTHDILKTSYNVSITGYPQTASGAIIDFSVRGNINSPNNPAFLNFTMNNIQSGNLRMRVNDGTTNQLDTTLTLMVSKIGVYRNGIWLLDYNDNFVWDGSVTDRLFNFGGTGYTPVYGDWDGNGKPEVGVFNNGIWYLDYNGNGVYDGAVIDRTATFGPAGYKPVVGDWDGTGKDKIGVELNGIWAVDYNGNYTWDGVVTDRYAGFGVTGDNPVVGDWDGTGKDKIGSEKDGFWAADYNGNYVWDGAITDRFAGFGQVGDKPVIGDWNGDGKDKIGMEINGFWATDYNGNFVWDGAITDRFAGFGSTGDIPVVGDWNNDGKAKIGSFKDGFWAVDYNGSYVWDGTVTDRFAGFGQTGDTPVAVKWS